MTKNERKTLEFVYGLLTTAEIMAVQKGYRRVEVVVALDLLAPLLGKKHKKHKKV